MTQTKTKFKKTEIGMIPKEMTDINAFKKLIKSMYEGFPNWQYKQMVEQVIVTEEMRKKLIDTHFLVKEQHSVDGQKQDVYMLGPNSLALVSAWETEELTKSIKILTLVVVVLSIITIFLQTI